ncbi:hypothetical protein [Rhodoblastus sp.]|uniref:hypothetical protein n=1 Tax=Rhodoblastus sp. TaxID=1962975 RepID=UPI003F9BCD7B
MRRSLIARKSLIAIVASLWPCLINFAAAADHFAGRCIGPLADLETQYLAALKAVQPCRIEGATLSLLYGAGARSSFSRK